MKVIEPVMGFTNDSLVLEQQRLWIGFLKGNPVSMDGAGGWRLVYYPIKENNKTKEVLRATQSPSGAPDRRWY